MRSNRTWAEFHAQGLLLGMYYDATDHTFCLFQGNRPSSLLGQTPLYDADTMEILGQIGSNICQATMRLREGKVKAGLLGPCDWLDTLARHYYEADSAIDELERKARNGKHAQTDK